MTYYLFVAIDYNDGTKSEKSVYAYDDKNKAVANFHSQLGGWMKNERTKHVLCTVISEKGGIYENDSWYAPGTEEGGLL